MVMRRFTFALLTAFAIVSGAALSGEGSDQAAVEVAVMNYLRGFEQADGEKLKRAFLVEHAHVKGLTTTDSGEWVVGSWEMGPVIEKWASRDPRPAMTGKILSVDIVHGQAAQVLLDFDGRYVDLLQLIKLKGEWRIVNKVYVPMPESDPVGSSAPT